MCWWNLMIKGNSSFYSIVISQCQASFRFSNITSAAILSWLGTERCGNCFPCYLYLLALAYLGANATRIIESLPQAKAATKRVKANTTYMFVFSCSISPIISWLLRYEKNNLKFIKILAIFTQGNFSFINEMYPFVFGFVSTFWCLWRIFLLLELL